MMSQHACMERGIPVGTVELKKADDTELGSKRCGHDKTHYQEEFAELGKAV